LYWVLVITGFLSLRFKETHGHWPGMKAKAKTLPDDEEYQRSSSVPGSTDEPLKKEEEAQQGGKVQVREIS